MRTDRAHWERVYIEKTTDSVSWFEPVPTSSLAMIDRLELPRDAPIVDVGGGASTLAAELLGRGYSDITVADISAASLERAREGFVGADRVRWVVADIRDHDFGRRFALWHDRAVFHFMVAEEDRRGYVATLERSLAPGGHLVIATFGPNGPTRCSGLPTARYGATELSSALGGVADLASSHLEEHRTPSGTEQQFLFAHLAAHGR